MSTVFQLLVATVCNMMADTYVIDKLYWHFHIGPYQRSSAKKGIQCANRLYCSHSMYLVWIYDKELLFVTTPF